MRYSRRFCISMKCCKKSTRVNNISILPHLCASITKCHKPQQMTKQQLLLPHAQKERQQQHKAQSLSQKTGAPKNRKKSKFLIGQINFCKKICRSTRKSVSNALSVIWIGSLSTECLVFSYLAFKSIDCALTTINGISVFRYELYVLSHHGGCQDGVA